MVTNTHIKLKTKKQYYGDKTVSNRFNRSLHNKLNEKLSKIREKQEISHREVIKKEKLENIQEDLEETPLMRNEEFEEFERKIEDINIKSDNDE